MHYVGYLTYERVVPLVFDLSCLQNNRIITASKNIEEIVDKRIITTTNATFFFFLCMMESDYQNILKKFSQVNYNILTGLE